MQVSLSDAIQPFTNQYPPVVQQPVRSRVCAFKTTGHIESRLPRESRDVRTIDLEYIKTVNKPSDLEEEKRLEMLRKNRIVSTKTIKRSFTKAFNNCLPIPEDPFEDEEQEEPRRALSLGTLECRRQQESTEGLGLKYSRDEPETSSEEFTSLHSTSVEESVGASQSDSQTQPKSPIIKEYKCRE